MCRSLIRLKFEEVWGTWVVCRVREGVKGDGEEERRGVGGDKGPNWRGLE